VRVPVSLEWPAYTYVYLRVYIHIFTPNTHTQRLPLPKKAMPHPLHTQHSHTDTHSLSCTQKLKHTHPHTFIDFGLATVSEAATTKKGHATPLRPLEQMHDTPVSISSKRYGALAPTSVPSLFKSGHGESQCVVDVVCVSIIVMHYVSIEYKTHAYE